ncbi:MAG: leucine-rich repeat protein [Acetivibrio sp.]
MKKTKINKIMIAAAMILAVGLLTKPVSIAAETKTTGFYQYDTIYGTNDVVITKYTGGEPKVVIPSKLGGKKVAKIGSDSFSENALIETVIFPKTISILDFSAFKDCENLQSVELNHGLNEIQGCAFYNCDALMQITIPDSVTYLGNGTYDRGIFESCDNLTMVTIGKNVEAISNSCFEECAKLQSVIIKEGVEKIEYEAFAGCVSLSAIEIPSTVKSLNNSCFINCTSLQNVKLNMGLEEIQRGAFYNCDALMQITIPDSVTYLGNGTYDRGIFESCDNLTMVTIGKNVEAISNSCFEECAKLQSVIIKEGVEKIEYEAFAGCVSLSAIEIPSTVKSLNNSCFINCTSLQNVKLNMGLEEIQSGAFYNCDALMQITIPNSVTYLGNNEYARGIFESCDNLYFVTIPNSVVRIIGDLIGKSKNATIKGYEGTVAQKYALKYEIPFTSLLSIPLTSFTFTSKEVEIISGTEMQLDYSISPKETTDVIVWKSSNNDIVEVDSIGRIKAKKSGRISIGVTTTSGFKGNMEINVLESPKTMTFPIFQKEAKTGSSFTQRVDMDGGRTDIPITYSSSNPNVATVNQNGTVAVISKGTTTITAEIFSGLKATYTVIGKTPTITSVKISNRSKTIEKGKSFYLKIKGTGKTANWKSSKPSVAVVSKNGKVTGKNSGKATMTTRVNGKKYTCYVVVKEK